LSEERREVSGQNQWEEEEMQEQDRERKQQNGFTLIELLIAIVVVGILTAVAIVGIGGLVNNGTTAACQASLDASKAATAVHFANFGTYPSTFSDMTGKTPPELEVPSGVTPAATTLKKGTSWTLTMSGGGATANTYACS
jgi:prepilin-type N-terminal cleavage/methylation domain-containing protein